MQGHIRRGGMVEVVASYRPLPGGMKEGEVDERSSFDVRSHAGHTYCSEPIPQVYLYPHP